MKFEISTAVPPGGRSITPIASGSQLFIMVAAGSSLVFLLSFTLILSLFLTVASYSFSLFSPLFQFAERFLSFVK